MSKTKINPRKSTDAASESDAPTAEKQATPTVFHPPDRFGFGELAHWPSWFGRYWPDRFFGELDRMGMEGIKVEEYRDDDDVVIRAEVPGIDPDDIEVSVENGRLSIKAERESRTESKDGLRSEFRYGSFARVISMPEGAKADDIEASCTDGILEVRVPVDDDAAEHGTKIAVKRG